MNIEHPDFTRVLEILNGGGNIHLHPIDFENVKDLCLRKGFTKVLPRLRKSSFLAQGQMITCSNFEIKPPAN